MKKKKMIQRPWCPFCGQKVERATDLPNRKMREFTVGNCSCGAVYSCDPTGHNVGAAMVETLVHACGDNWDLAWELMPEDDYLTGRIEDYDEETHQVTDLRHVDGRAVRGVLYFVRLHTEMSELADRLKEKKQQNTVEKEKSSGYQPPPVEPAREDKAPRKRASKKLVKELAAAADEDELVALCLDDKKTLRLMQRLLYDPDEANRWQTAWLIGQVTSRVATRDPGQVSELVHRLFEACQDSAATPWGMIETIGAVVGARPDIFGAFAKHLLSFVSADSTRVQVIWALAEIAGNRPDLVRETPFFSMFQFLNHPSADVRGQMARLLGKIGATEATMQLMGLHQDEAELVIWEKGEPLKTTVAQEAAKAITTIQGMKKAS
ncbi:MAG: PBS lyase [Desulfobulbaceae bacterium]|nr:MAG: PBS lyase [Desulfobulbaceae bacterium]